MWFCLSCTKHGDLQGGSLVYDQALSKYSILQHIKAEDEDEWATFEADNGPWPTAGPSSGFRIGFGDYFDCDSLPECGISVMAWSGTPSGQQPWQTWARILDLCQCKEDRVDALEDEIDHLTDAFNSKEIPLPRTKQNIAKFEANLDELRKKLRTAQGALRKCRDANPLTED